MKLTYFGHAFVEIETGNSRIFIDPFITGNSFISQPLEYFIERKPTHIFLTHGHSDHIGSTQEIAKSTGAMVVGSAEIVHFVQHTLGVSNVHSMGVGGSHNFGDFSAKLFQAVHGTTVGKAGSGFSCFPTGVIIRAEGKSIYHAGDTALTYDMKLLGEYDCIDIALLPIGDNYTMGIDDALIAASFIKSKLTIPIHFDTFPAIKSDAMRFIGQLGQGGKLLKPGETILCT